VARPAVVAVLLVEDNPGDARLVELMLSEVDSATFKITRAGRLGEALDTLAGEEFDVVLLDLSLPDASGLDGVNAMRSAAAYLPVVVLSGMNDEDVALNAIQGGAEDYLVKGQGDGDLISRVVRYAIERKRTEERLAYLSQYDSLTGLANRILFEDRLQQALARAERDDSLVALMSLDLDRFKDFNDALGHGFGDMMLKTVADRLKECVREGDTVARLGSDEFGIELDGIEDAQAVAQVARRISDSLSEPFTIYEQEIFLTVSIGIAVKSSSEPQDLMKDANAALQRAKETGRNNYQFFAPEMNIQAFERLAMESRLRYAVDRDELDLHYQPQVEVSTGRVVGVEALLRWRHPELGVVSPAKFIPVLEETGLILPVGEWVIKTACEQIRAWKDVGLPTMRVAVNLSAQQFRQQDLPEIVFRSLRDARLEPENLELEITESILMEDSEESNAKLEKLKLGRGLRISIDDFGTGYSSLAYLKRFPIDVLKIDQSFIREMDEDSDDAAIVAAIIMLAHNLRLEVVAEGVETEAQLNFLRRKDCDQVQGYYLSRPLPAGDFARLLEENENLIISDAAG